MLKKKHRISTSILDIIEKKSTKSFLDQLLDILEINEIMKKKSKK